VLQAAKHHICGGVHAGWQSDEARKAWSIGGQAVLLRNDYVELDSGDVGLIWSRQWPITKM